MKLIKYTLISGALVLMLSAGAKAQDYKKFAIEVAGGATYPNMDIDPLINYAGRAGIRYNLTNLFALKGEFEKGFLEGGEDEYNRTFTNDYMRYGLQGYINLGRIVKMEDFARWLNLQYRMGAGMIQNNVTDITSEDDLALPEYTESDFIYNFGLLMQIRLSNTFAINLAGDYYMGGNDLLDGYTNTSVANKYNDRYTTAMLGLSIYLGKSGVDHADWVDMSQNEELKESAESNQKAIKKMHDSMEDTDDDGVIDILDQDNATADGVRVDTKGLPLDTDYDGIPDYLDDCPVEAGTEANNGCPGMKPDTAMGGTGTSGSGSEGQGGQGGEGRDGTGTGGNRDLSSDADYPKGSRSSSEVEDYPVVTLESSKDADPDRDIYYIIAGSFSMKPNAVDFAEYLRSEGVNSTQILFVKDRGLYRVSYESFNDEFTARQKLDEYRNRYNSSAWLLMQ